MTGHSTAPSIRHTSLGSTRCPSTARTAHPGHSFATAWPWHAPSIRLMLCPSRPSYGTSRSALVSLQKATRSRARCRSTRRSGRCRCTSTRRTATPRSIGTTSTWGPSASGSWQTRTSSGLVQGWIKASQGVGRTVLLRASRPRGWSTSNSTSIKCTTCRSRTRSDLSRPWPCPHRRTARPRLPQLLAVTLLVPWRRPQPLSRWRARPQQQRRE
mmetsp:Transcript_136257/g.236375  ORF Transcript_136257/g.236375 Transcript_136257/m.236375 type:complete len:214 (+) Transcript_136257:710-1351(+)